MHLHKACMNLFHRLQTARLHVLHQTLNLTLRSNQSGNVHPFSRSDRNIRQQSLPDILIRCKLQILQALDHRISQEFMNRRLIKSNSLVQGHILYLRTLIRIDFRSLSRYPGQVLQNLPSFHHLLNGIRAQQVIINLIQAVRIFTQISFRPFLGITDGTHAPQVHSRHQIRSILILYQIRKRQVRSIRMFHMTSHHQRKGSDTRRPQNIRIGSCLGTALQRSLMNRP